MARGRPKKKKVIEPIEEIKPLSNELETPECDFDDLKAKENELVTELNLDEDDASMKGVENLEYSELVISNEEKISELEGLSVDNNDVKEIPSLTECDSVEPIKNSDAKIMHINPINESIIEIDNSNKLTLDDYQKEFNADYFEKLKANGCDYKSFGEWQRAYCQMIINAFKLKRKTILDIGCAYGSITHAFKMLQCVSTGIEVSKAVMSDKFKSVTIHNAMVQDMSIIPDKCMDLVHASYLLNHIPASELDKAFTEMARVMKDDGFIFVIYNNGMNEVNSDFNHKHSKSFVIETANNNGLVLIDASEELKHCDTSDYKFMTNYNWCYHVFKRDGKK